MLLRLDSTNYDLLERPHFCGHSACANNVLQDHFQASADLGHPSTKSGGVIRAKSGAAPAKGGIVPQGADNGALVPLKRSVNVSRTDLKNQKKRGSS